MAIVFTRIDDRLVHGQVVESWLRMLTVDSVLVANDQVARDPMQCALLSLSLPSEIRLFVFSLKEAIEKFKENYFAERRLCILLSSPRDLLTLIEGGVKIESVNVGGLHYSPGKVQLLKSFCVDEEDIKALEEIAKRKIELEGRVVPSDEKIDILKLIEDYRKRNA